VHCAPVVPPQTPPAATHTPLPLAPTQGLPQGEGPCSLQSSIVDAVCINNTKGGQLFLDLAEGGGIKQHLTTIAGITDL